MQQQGIAGIAGHHHAWPTTCIPAFPLQGLNAGAETAWWEARAGRSQVDDSAPQPSTRYCLWLGWSAGCTLSSPSPWRRALHQLCAIRPLRWVVVL